METNEGDERRRAARPALLPVGGKAPDPTHGAERHAELVFRFSGRQGLGVTDLALVLTARLKAGMEGRVWVKQIPYETWGLLRSLGLDHLFQVVPDAGDAPN